MYLPFSFNTLPASFGTIDLDSSNGIEGSILTLVYPILLRTRPHLIISVSSVGIAFSSGDIL